MHILASLRPRLFHFRPAFWLSRQALCARLGIAYTADMTSYWEHRDRFHILAGNNGALAHLLSLEQFRKAAQSAYWQRAYSESHVEWIASQHRTISLDEQWRHGLADEQVAAIEADAATTAVYEALVASS